MRNGGKAGGASAVKKGAEKGCDHKGYELTRPFVLDFSVE